MNKGTQLMALEDSARRLLARAPNGSGQRSSAFRKIVEKAASLDDSNAICTLAGVLLFYSRRRSDIRRGNELLSEAVRRRVPDALDLLGRCLEGGIGRRRVLRDARKAYEAGAELGSVDGMVDCGRCYYHGIGGAADVSRAYCWWKEAAKRGHSESMFQCGRMAEIGEGVRRNRAVARRWYARSASHGHKEGAEQWQRLDELLTSD